MNYYTSQIPPTLAEKLKEKGMPIANVTDSMTGEKSCLYTYAHIFDWLMSERGVYISGFRRFDHWRWEYATDWRFRIEPNDISQEEVNGYMVNGNSWHEAAEKAIEKALTLI